MDSGTAAAIMKLLSAMSPDLLFWLIVILIATPFGVVFLVMVFWFVNERRHAQMLHLYREDMRSILSSYGKDISRLTTFYENNVELVRAWEKVANGFHDTVVLNTQTMQRMIDVCITNQFCPNARLPK